MYNGWYVAYREERNVGNKKFNAILVRIRLLPKSEKKDTGLRDHKQKLLYLKA